MLVEGLRFPEGPRWHDGRLVVLGPARRARSWPSTPTASVETIVEVPEPPVGPRLGSRRPHARRLDARPAAAAARRRRAHRGRRPLAARHLALQRHGRRRGRAAPTSATSASTSTAAPTPVHGRTSCASIPTARSRSRPTSCASRTARSSRPTARTLIVGESYGGAPHRVRRRRRRHAVEPARVGASSTARCRTASASTPKVRSGRRARSPVGCCACARAARSPTR